MQTSLVGAHHTLKTTQTTSIIAPRKTQQPRPSVGVGEKKKQRAEKKQRHPLSEAARRKAETEKAACMTMGLAKPICIFYPWTTRLRGSAHYARLFCLPSCAKATTLIRPEVQSARLFFSSCLLHQRSMLGRPGKEVVPVQKRGEKQKRSVNLRGARGSCVGAEMRMGEWAPGVNSARPKYVRKMLMLHHVEVRRGWQEMNTPVRRGAIFPLHKTSMPVPLNRDRRGKGGAVNTFHE